ncbi:MAG: PmoA family protein [Verrucomicrobiales bacterium]|nr:PmoA family protein [Verrucomicrobiales bacterium]
MNSKALNVSRPLDRGKSLILPCLAAFSIHLVNAQDDYPIVPDDIEVSLFARDPLVRNPCVIAFDERGRLCVGMGPQYRAPKPDTPPDSVWIVTDEDGDGTAETRKEFATGFNAIQGLAWKGDWLWIANAPELTRVRDTNGDDVADEYIRVYTDLGNLEHALHGLNFGPDGRLYMSKGNSKGLTVVPDRIAPAPFRELWGIEVPEGTPEPEPKPFTPAHYEKNYQDPRDDWGVTGGILRCDDDGGNLEIVSRGFRNPWDIAFDDEFNWLGTDNDQTMGDKIFAPFYGSHFGWGHSWSYDWKGDDHLPTAPSSGPLFEGSGAGVIFCGLESWPEKYRDAFFISDWLNREVLIYQTKWDGAWRKPNREELALIAHAGGGRSMPLSEGRAFDPVDLEMGPDGALWVTSWGRQYGAHYENDELANEGRVYRLFPKEFSFEKTERNWIADLASHVPAWRTNAQEELISQGDAALPRLKAALQSDELSTAHETWLVWTIGRIDPAAWFDANRNQTVQSLRLAAFHRTMRPEVREALTDPEPRIRLEAVLALREIGATDAVNELLDLAATETDRIVYYAAWGALMDLVSIDERRALLDSDKRDRVRLALFLSLLEEDALSDEELSRILENSTGPIHELAEKRLGGKHEFEHRGRPLTATEAISKKIDPPVVVPFTDVNASSGRPYRAAVLKPGVPYYTDRDYRVTRVPAALDGLTFLQTACGDADASSGITVSLNLKYPSTVYLIDDARAESLPTWARDTWKPTGMTIEGTDPKTMNVYEARFPAGPLTLGTSRDGIQAGKGNYLVAVRPTMLAPDGTVATAETILPLLDQADVDRGRDLFFSSAGANCASCHQVDGIGNNHAPDLTEIASRADAATLIESILEPSASIVEGFAAHAVSTKGGDAYSGIILQETGRHVTMALMGGATVKIPRNEIDHREGLPVSAMPAGFGSMMTNQQLADLVGYLQTFRKPEPITASAGEFEFRQIDGELQLYLGQTRVATYLLEHDDLSRRAFVNVRTPSGIQVTRNFPPRKPEDIDPGYGAEDGIIHPVMHAGLWMSFGWIDGNDYWRLRAKVKHEGFLEDPVGKKGEAGFQSRDRYLSEDGNTTICIQETAYRFRLIDEGIVLEWDAQFYNDERDFVFGDQEESGLAIRIASPLRVQGGNGEIVNDRGEKNGDGTWGREFEWINYSGVVDGKRVGLSILPHPDNPRTCWSHSRDYGALVSNPFPKQPKERRDPYVTTPVKKGERFRLRYSVLIHEVPAQEFDPAGLAAKLR